MKKASEDQWHENTTKLEADVSGTIWMRRGNPRSVAMQWLPHFFPLEAWQRSLIANKHIRTYWAHQAGQGCTEGRGSAKVFAKYHLLRPYGAERILPRNALDWKEQRCLLNVTTLFAYIFVLLFLRAYVTLSVSAVKIGALPEQLDNKARRRYDDRETVLNKQPYVCCQHKQTIHSYICHQ